MSEDSKLLYRRYKVRYQFNGEAIELDFACYDPMKKDLCAIVILSQHFHGYPKARVEAEAELLRIGQCSWGKNKITEPSFNQIGFVREKQFKQINSWKHT